MKRKIKALVVLLAMLYIISPWVILMINKPKPKERLQPDSNASEWEGKQDLDKLKTDVKQIAIPGTESLVFTADQKEQKVNFYNPKSNDCLMVFVLFVEDEEVWRSGYCAPGNGYYNIELSKPLEEGEYNARLLHECFKEDGAALNSANVRFKLYVQ
jgi:hypothetical protein